MTEIPIKVKVTYSYQTKTLKRQRRVQNSDKHLRWSGLPTVVAELLF